MSPDPVPELALFSMPERRLNYRYPVSLDLTYRAFDTGQVGGGQTLNMSSSGICFSGSEPLLPGTKLEISMEWPILLDGVYPLKLVAKGPVLWSREGRTVVMIASYQFHVSRRTVNRVA